MIRLAKTSILAIALWALFASSASADFGISSFDTQITAGPGPELTRTALDPAAGQYTQAGAHPYSIVTHIEWNNHPDTTTNPNFAGIPTPDGDLKDAEAELPPGLVGNPTAIPRCTSQQLFGKGHSGDPRECPSDSQVGVVNLRLNVTGVDGDFLKLPDTSFPIFNMYAPAGEPARFGFYAVGTLVYFDAALRSDGDYGVTVGSHNVVQALRVIASDVTFWGNPADARHDAQRCLSDSLIDTPTTAKCPGGLKAWDQPHPYTGPAVPFLTMPTSCTAPEEGKLWKLRTDSWEAPGAWEETSLFSHMAPYAPEGSGEQVGVEGCEKVPFEPDFSAQPSNQDAAAPTGLEVKLSFPSDGILNVKGLSQSNMKKAVVTLPEGMTINPSQADGLGVCTPSQYASESLAQDNEGCPANSKIGTVAVKTPLLEEDLQGSVYVAEPYRNPFRTLIAIYVVIKNPTVGVMVKVAGKVEPDPKTGQIVTTFDDLPQQAITEFDFRFREGPRAPLITPPKCGSYATEAKFYPWARPSEAVEASSSFQVKAGPGGSPCPAAGVPPFHPGFSAGTLNNNAGSYSPFLMRLTRQDGEQDMTKFSALLPPGVSARIAGVSWCSEGAIQLAREKTGAEEREAPSCPANSQIGNIIAGAGVGSTLIYVPGKLYLSGPFNGAPLSVVAVVPAVAGPFDVGTVVTHIALGHDPRTARVRVEGDRSDPIPHILAGIPLAIRDIRVSADRPHFTINPTSCDPSQVAATLFGSNLDLFSPADDLPVGLTSRFQAAGCAALGLKPALSLRLNGATERGGFPAFRAILTPRAGDANLSSAVVRLPHSAFLEQSHIRTICTRVQYAQKACPPGSIYGHVKAWTPLLDQPLEGPVYLRSSDHKLPDMVLSMNGVVDIEAVGHVDSVRGGIRSSFEELPDAPVSKVLLTMQGQKKGLIVNSTNLCKGKPKRASAQLDGQNGKQYDFKPALKSACKNQGNNAKRRNRTQKHH